MAQAPSELTDPTSPCYQGIAHPTDAATVFRRLTRAVGPLLIEIGIKKPCGNPMPGGRRDHLERCSRLDESVDDSCPRLRRRWQLPYHGATRKAFPPGTYRCATRAALHQSVRDAQGARRAVRRTEAKRSRSSPTRPRAARHEASVSETHPSGGHAQRLTPRLSPALPILPAAD